jgi:phage major head subunit gpT-like protein
MSINTSQIRSLLWPGINAVFGMLDTYPAEYKEIFDEYQSEKNFEKDVEVRALPMAQLKPEGSSVAFNDMGQTYEYSYQINSYAAGFNITQEAIEDNQYKSQFPQATRDLRNSLLETRNIEAANILNNGFSSSYNGGDGVPLFSTAHPIYGGTVSNTFSIPQPLNETSLTNAITAIGEFRASSGNRAIVKPLKLIVPNALWNTAKVLLGSKFSPDSANNAINAVHDDVLPQGYRINHYLVNPTSWYIKLDCPESLKHFVRKKPQINTFLDTSTYTFQVTAVERYAFGWSDFRGIFGTQGV